MIGEETLLRAAFYALATPAILLTLTITVRQLVLSVGALRLGKPDASGRIGAGHEVEGDDADLPHVAVIVPAHNEARVVADGLNALLQADYPRDRFKIVVVNDRSTDDTGAIVDRIALAHPVIRPMHRSADAAPGKPAALRDAIDATPDVDVYVFFDADYLPSPGLIRALVAPFINPRVGATMGRVVPVNSGANTLTRLIDLERRGGYVIDQQMREAWGLLPQFGGTVGAVSASALARVGGWQAGLMTEDTHLTYSLFLAGYDVRYLNHAACYEESPEDWRARYKQVRRWAYGHNECMFAFLGKVITARGRRLVQRVDAAMILLFYLYPAVSLATLPVTILGPALVGANPGWILLSLAPLFCGFGNLAPFFQILVAAGRDRQLRTLTALPLLPLSSALNMLAASHGLAQLATNRLLRRKAVWDKTSRFRSLEPKPGEASSLATAVPARLPEH